MSMNNSDLIKNDKKLNELKARYKQKDLSRDERYAIAEEIRRKAYRIDTRPSMSLRKSSLISAVVYFTIFMGTILIAIEGNINKNDSKLWSAAVMIMAVLEIAVMGYGVFMWFSHKVEPGDELSRLNTIKADSIAVWSIIILIFTAAYIYMTFTDHPLLTFDKSTIFFSLCSFVLLHSALRNLLFLWLDRNGVSADVEE